MDSETEVVESDNELLDNEVLPPELKGYIPRNPTNISSSNKISTQCSMVWNNLIIGSNEIHSVENPTTMLLMLLPHFLNPLHQPTSSQMRPSWRNTVSNRDSSYLVIEAKLQYKKNYNSFMIAGLLNLINPKTSVMNREEGVCHILCF